jgi:hypothetical protein
LSRKKQRAIRGIKDKKTTRRCPPPWGGVGEEAERTRKMWGGRKNEK